MQDRLEGTSSKLAVCEDNPREVCPALTAGEESHRSASRP